MNKKDIYHDHSTISLFIFRFLQSVDVKVRKALELHVANAKDSMMIILDEKMTESLSNRKMKSLEQQTMDMVVNEGAKENNTTLDQHKEAGMLFSAKSINMMKSILLLNQETPIKEIESTTTTTAKTLKRLIEPLGSIRRTGENKLHDRSLIYQRNGDDTVDLSNVECLVPPPATTPIQLSSIASSKLRFHMCIHSSFF
jgi:hypothetical protein